MSLSLYHLEGACLAVGKRLHHYVYALMRSLEPCAVKIKFTAESVQMSIINLEFCKKKPHGYWILEHNTVMDAAKNTSVKKR